MGSSFKPYSSENSTIGEFQITNQNNPKELVRGVTIDDSTATLEKLLGASKPSESSRRIKGESPAVRRQRNQEAVKSARGGPSYLKELEPTNGSAVRPTATTDAATSDAGGESSGSPPATASDEDPQGVVCTDGDEDPGSSVELARADHVHSLSAEELAKIISTTTPEVVAIEQTGNVVNINSTAPTGSDDGGVNVAISDSAGNAGEGNVYSREGHSHNLPEGTLYSFIDGAVEVESPLTKTGGGSGALTIGVNITALKPELDIPEAGTVLPVDVDGDEKDDGASDLYSKVDHKHKLNQNILEQLHSLEIVTDAKIEGVNLILTKKTITIADGKIVVGDAVVTEVAIDAEECT